MRARRKSWKRIVLLSPSFLLISLVYLILDRVRTAWIIGRAAVVRLAYGAGIIIAPELTLLRRLFITEEDVAAMMRAWAEFRKKKKK